MKIIFSKFLMLIAQMVVGLVIKNETNNGGVMAKFLLLINFSIFFLYSCNKNSPSEKWLNKNIIILENIRENLGLPTVKELGDEYIIESGYDYITYKYTDNSYPKFYHKRLYFNSKNALYRERNLFLNSYNEGLIIAAVFSEEPKWRKVGVYYEYFNNELNINDSISVDLAEFYLRKWNFKIPKRTNPKLLDTFKIQNHSTKYEPIEPSGAGLP